MTDPLISVIIPAYNEEDTIGFVINGVANALNQMNVSHEIIIVNDGSFDNTLEIAKKYDVVILNNYKNFGKGHALRRGLLQARGRLIVTMDADGSHDPDNIRFLIRPLVYDNVDAVFGVRFHNQEGRRSTSRLHLLGNKIINFVIYLLTGKHVSDSQSGFRAFKRTALRKLTLISNEFEIESEIVIKLLKRGFFVLEVPISCKKRVLGNSKVNAIEDGFKILKVIIKSSFVN
jgi:glycosyltransferase involved in cell wall biosynthesis